MLRSICLWLLCVILSLVILSIFWTPYDITVLNISNRFSDMSMVHVLGTDQYGRDMVSMLMVGARNSLFVAFLGTLLGAFLGGVLGAVSAFIRPVAQLTLSHVNDFVFAFPAIITAVMFTAVFGHSVWIAIIAIGLFNIPVFYRMMRAQVLSIMVRDYVMSARAMGQRDGLIFMFHILPNTMSVLRVQIVLTFALSILAEASLSYMGLGIQSPSTSLGRMLFENQSFIMILPELSIYPGLIIILIVFLLNTLVRSR